MKILILSNSNPYRTAGIVAKDFMDGLKEIEGNEVKLVVRMWGNYQDKNIIPIDGFFKYNQKRIFRKGINGLKKLGLFKKEIMKTNRDYCVQDYDQTRTYYPTWRILKEAGFTPDVILVLFMQNFLSYKNLYEFNYLTKAPIFLFLMDMAPMTGGCHYAWDCKGYLKKCGCCPAIFSNDMRDQSNINWQYKKQLIEKTDIRAIAGTEWTYRQLKKSSIFENKNKHKILLPINENIFHPADKASSRKKLNLPINKKIIFSGAVSLTEKRKGFDQLVKALEILKENLEIKEQENIHIALAGKGKTGLEQSLPFSYTMLGYLSPTDLPRAFQAADVFVSPSIEDSGPMMINQSVMCGTPVVAFDIGVALDLVHNGETGYKAKLKDCEDLANGIKFVLSQEDKQYRIITNKCRTAGLEFMSLIKFQKIFMRIIHDN